MNALETLSKPQGQRHPAVMPRPASRWVLRFVVPILIVLAAAALLAYAARDAFLPALEVEVMPVLTRAAPLDQQPRLDQAPQRSSEGAILAQAPGWIEPDPYGITVQSLISGVVQEVKVLEGERVEAGQIVATLIAEDAELSLQQAVAEGHELAAAVDRAEAAVRVAEARADELRDEIERKRELVDVGGISQGDFARLQMRLGSQMAEIEAARAAVRQADAAVARQQIAVQQAELMLSRTIIRAPVSGVVLDRAVVPGTRIAMAGDGPGEAHMPGIVRLYDPAHLQVRADVPLSDAARVGLGTIARITTEVLPDHVFTGEVTRIVHLADIQRNTVEVKVRIHNPSPLLKPDMLARVRFVAGDPAAADPQSTQEQPDTINHAEGSLRIYAPISAIRDEQGNRANAWVVEPGPGGRSLHAALRTLTLGQRDDELIHVIDGLQPGDRLIIGADERLVPGTRISIRREATTVTMSHMEGQ